MSNRQARYASSLIDVRDIAAVAVLAAGGAYDGEALELTGPEAIAGAEIAEILAEALRKAGQLHIADNRGFLQRLARSRRAVLAHRGAGGAL